MKKPTIDGIFPASPSQQGFILGSLANRDGAPFVEQATWLLMGRLDMNRLRAVWEELIQRHEILRTAFALNLSDAPRQVILSNAHVEIDSIEVIGENERGFTRSLSDLLELHRTAPFDLTCAPLLRLAVHHCSETEHQLSWTHHHAILDGWSQISLLQEMLESYNGRSQAGPAPSFGKYAAWLANRDTRRHREFWRRALADYVPPAAMPNLALLPGADRFGMHEIRFSTFDMRPLEAYAKANNLTLSSILLAAVSLLAARLRETREILIGVTVNGRSPDYAHVEAIVGPLVNTVPLRVKVVRESEFAVLACALQQDLASAAPFGDCSAGEIHDWAEVPADRPLFDAIVAIANYPALNVSDGNVPDALRVCAKSLRAVGGRTLQPLVMLVSLFDGLEIKFINDRSRIADDLAANLVSALRSCLLAIGHSAAPLAVAELLDRFASPPSSASEVLPALADVNGTAIEGTIQAVVAAAIAAALGRESIHVDADFFALGGHSILAIKLLATLRSTFSLDLTLQDILRAPTASRLACRIGELIGTAEALEESSPQLVPQPGELGKSFPLSAIQEAYWVGRQPGFELSGVDSHIYVEIDIPGLDVDLLEEAWRKLVIRHPMLRAVITPDGRQRVLLEVTPFIILRSDLRDVPDPAVALASMRKRLANPRRVLGGGALYTIETASLADGLTRLFMSFDLLIGDAQSWHTLYAELLILYRHPQAVLEPLEITFQDYLKALQSIRETKAYIRAQQYWHERMETLPAPPALAFARQTGESASPHFVRRQVKLSETDTLQLRALAAEFGVTPSALLLGIFSELIARFSNSAQFLINLTILNRPPLHPQIDAIVGDFTSLSLLAVSLNEPTFAARVRRLQRQLWMDLDHREYSGLQVLREIGERQGRPLAALAPIVFTSTLDLGKAARRKVDSLPGKIVYAIGQTPQVAFDYQTCEVDGELIINWDTVDSLFAPDYIDAMFAQHTRLLRSLIADPGLMHADSLFPKEVAGEVKMAPLGAAQLLHEPFVREAKRRPNALAIIMDECRLTYAQTLNLSIVAADMLMRETRDPGPVAIVMEKGWEQVVGAIAASMSGRPFIPIEASWPAARIASIIKKAGGSAVFTQRRILPGLTLPASVKVIAVDALPVHDGALLEPPDIPTTCNDLAYVIFTSGSTGEPKGVMIQHFAALNTILDVNCRFGVNASDRVFAISPFAFDLSIYDIFGVLGVGGAVVMPTEGERRDPARWAALCAKANVTVWNSVPVLMDLLLDALAAIPQRSLASFRLCLLSGDWIPLSLPALIRRQAPDVQIVSLGGATEGAIWSVCYPIASVESDWASIPYGRAMKGQTIEVVGDDLAPCPVWVPGQIVIGGHGVALGYLGEIELTLKAFVADPLGRGRLYLTGDRGRLLPDGNIELLGRCDDQIKVGGYRVEPREIEVVMVACAGVEAALVIPVGKPPKRSLVAFVKGATTVERLREEIALRLPAYMIPQSMQIISRVPLSPTGKIDRRALVDMIQVPRHQHDVASAATAIHGALRAILFAEIGELPLAEANLLGLGLTSVKVIRVINAIEHQFGIRPSIEFFYRSPTLQTLNDAINAGQKPPALGRVDSTPGTARSTIWTDYDLLTDSLERSVFRSKRPAFSLRPDRRILTADEGFAHRFHARARSSNAFPDSPVFISAINDMLQCMRRVTTVDGQRFLYPSAGGLYSVDLYVHFRPDRIKGVAAGLYYYHPDAHDLTLVVGDIELDSALHLGCVNIPIASSAAFTVFLVTDPGNSAPLYGAEAEHLNALNAGYMAQLLCENAAAANIRLCPLHGYNFGAIQSMFPGGDRAVLLHLLAGGNAHQPSTAAKQCRESGGPEAERMANTRDAACPGWVTVTSTAPLSAGQERLLASEYALSDGRWPTGDPNDRVRPMDSGAILIEGRLDIDALGVAVRLLVERQAALRTTIRFPSLGPPVQVVMPANGRGLAVHPLLDRQETDLPTLIRERGGRTVAPTDPQLFHAELFHLGKDRHVLFLHIHHLVSDGWSIGVLYRELSEHYNATRERRKPGLLPLEVSFHEVCHRMRRERHGAKAKVQLTYWAKELARAAAPLDFRGTSSLPKRGLVSVNDVAVTLSAAVASDLRKASMTCTVPGGLSGPILAAVAILIHKQSGATDVDIGSMIAGRTTRDTEGLIGYFVNTVTIRLTIDPNATLGSVLAQANGKIALAMENQDVPIQDVNHHVNQAWPGRGGVTPYTVTVALNGMRMTSLTLAGTKCTDLFRTEAGDLKGQRHVPSAMALRWVFDESNDGIQGTLTYDTDLFRNDAVNQCVSDFCEVLATMACADMPLGTFWKKIDCARR